ncbi:hypothetical protein ACMXYR_09500 [Neptuniibacter sp. QD29_5]|uniref:hypothetical protein n=1 Tax=Neptuniibacter sp. QD29_5 TaxID=3398207 RepID=UPI0039F5B3E1
MANIVGKSYSEMKQIANAMGIFADDKSLWSQTDYVRQLLASQNISVSSKETPFQSWKALPDLALLAIKHYQEEGKDFWHWVVFKHMDGKPYVLDSASYLDANLRTDFDQMQPKWYIEVERVKA